MIIIMYQPLPRHCIRLRGQIDMEDSHGCGSQGVSMIMREMNNSEVIIQLVSVVKRVK